MAVTATRTLGCVRCGSCCEPVPFTTEEHQTVTAWSTAALRGVPGPGTDEGWAHWLATGWTGERRHVAIARYDPGGRWRQDADFIAEHWTPQGEHCVCDRYDPDTASCTAHDERPPVCRDYPWYRDGPTQERAARLEPQCSYLLDVAPTQRPAGARPLIPIEPVKASR